MQRMRLYLFYLHPKKWFIIFVFRKYRSLSARIRAAADKNQQNKPQTIIIHELLNSVAHVLHFQSITTNTNESMPRCNRPVDCVVMISIHRQRPNRINKNYMRIHFIFFHQNVWIRNRLQKSCVKGTDRLSPHRRDLFIWPFQLRTIVSICIRNTANSKCDVCWQMLKHHESHHIAQCTEDTKTMCADDRFSPPSFPLIETCITVALFSY